MLRETGGAAVKPVINPDVELEIDTLLSAVPVRNESIRFEKHGDDQLLVYVPIKKRWYMGPPLSWIMPLSRDRVIALDKIGREIWELCDGQHRIEQIVEKFAEHHHLRFHQARLSIMEFLRQLTRRGLIVVVGHQEDE